MSQRATDSSPDGPSDGTHTPPQGGRDDTTSPMNSTTDSTTHNNKNRASSSNSNTNNNTVNDDNDNNNTNNNNISNVETVQSTPPGRSPTHESLALAIGHRDSLNEERNTFTTISQGPVTITKTSSTVTVTNNHNMTTTTTTSHVSTTNNNNETVKRQESSSMVLLGSGMSTPHRPPADFTSIVSQRSLDDIKVAAKEDTSVVTSPTAPTPAPAAAPAVTAASAAAEPATATESNKDDEKNGAARRVTTATNPRIDRTNERLTGNIISPLQSQSTHQKGEVEATHVIEAPTVTLIPAAKAPTVNEIAPSFNKNNGDSKNNSSSDNNNKNKTSKSDDNKKADSFKPQPYPEVNMVKDKGIVPKQGSSSPVPVPRRLRVSPPVGSRGPASTSAPRTRSGSSPTAEKNTGKNGTNSSNNNLNVNDNNDPSSAGSALISGAGITTPLSPQRMTTKQLQDTVAQLKHDLVQAASQRNYAQERSRTLEKEVSSTKQLVEEMKKQIEDLQHQLRMQQQQQQQQQSSAGYIDFSAPGSRDSSAPRRADSLGSTPVKGSGTMRRTAAQQQQPQPQLVIGEKESSPAIAVTPADGEEPPQITISTSSPTTERPLGITASPTKNPMLLHTTSLGAGGCNASFRSFTTSISLAGGGQLSGAVFREVERETQARHVISTLRTENTALKSKIADLEARIEVMVPYLGAEYRRIYQENIDVIAAQLQKELRKAGIVGEAGDQTGEAPQSVAGEKDAVPVGSQLRHTPHIHVASVKQMQQELQQSMTGSCDRTATTMGNNTMSRRLPTPVTVRGTSPRPPSVSGSSTRRSTPVSATGSTRHATSVPTATRRTTTPPHTPRINTTSSTRPKPGPRPASPFIGTPKPLPPPPGRASPSYRRPSSPISGAKRSLCRQSSVLTGTGHTSHETNSTDAPSKRSQQQHTSVSAEEQQTQQQSQSSQPFIPAQIVQRLTAKRTPLPFPEAIPDSAVAKDASSTSKSPGNTKGSSGSIKKKPPSSTVSGGAASKSSTVSSAAALTSSGRGPKVPRSHSSNPAHASSLTKSIGNNTAAAVIAAVVAGVTGDATRRTSSATRSKTSTPVRATSATATKSRPRSSSTGRKGTPVTRASTSATTTTTATTAAPTVTTAVTATGSGGNTSANNTPLTPPTTSTSAVAAASSDVYRPTLVSPVIDSDITYYTYHPIRMVRHSAWEDPVAQATAHTVTGMPRTSTPK